jgi:PAS domain-containing protein
VIPTAVGSADVTSLVADRIVREILTSLALRRRPDATGLRGFGARALGSVRFARMAGRRHKHIVLILAREVASNLATPALIADEEGRLVFYNEAAEAVLGRPFAEAGEVPLDEWTATFDPRTLEDAKPLPDHRRPATIALTERRPAHERFRIRSRDGVEREVSATALPLFAHADEFVGIIAFAWREQ